MAPISPADLARALAVARGDFYTCGLYATSLNEVPVRLTHWGDAYGYCTDTGEIEIPAWSWSRLREERDGGACSLEDVVRHELAHALAHRHMPLVDTPAFAETFGAAYWDEWADEVDFDPREYVTAYATSAPCEDFAETVMVFARLRGRVSRYASRRGVMRGFRYVAALARALRPHRGVPARSGSRRPRAIRVPAGAADDAVRLIQAPQPGVADLALPASAAKVR